MSEAARVIKIETLRFKEAQFGYEGAQPVFSGLTVDVPTERNILVTGPAASGQSTFLKLLAVLLQPNQGHYFINEQDTTDMSFEEFLPLRRKIGYTFDYGGLFSNRTLHDNLTLPLLYHKILSPSQASREVAAFAKTFHFESQLHLRPALVSGGLRKLICVLRALILRPEMLVMDDPFTGLDSESSRNLIRILHERRKTGELKHLFFTSRDEVWPTRLGCDSLVIENGIPRFEPGNFSEVIRDVGGKVA